MKYIARITFRILQQGSAKIIFDEQLRLIEAADKKEAFGYAHFIGKSEEEVLQGENAETRWEFIDVKELWDLEEKENGALLYTFTKSPKREKDYITFVKDRSRRIAESLQLKEHSPAVSHEKPNRHSVHAR